MFLANQFRFRFASFAGRPEHEEKSTGNNDNGMK